ncbi:outer membrane receptor protein involved in Fe transport [Alteromonadaceae bacterium 2753L.S.0a.02]|nr:outer membrane receptor protein involved in Fe transport [Alteromonadaceae bacterium 2753L.S.0a.02]
MSHSFPTYRPARHPLASAITMAIACTTTTWSTASFAQQERRALEEIVVTAQKRVENLQEVPLSVATISGEKIDESGIENLADLTAHMPNIHFTETGFSTQVRVRGIGSDNSQGMEQSVGMYIDGIYYGRAQLFRLPMMDMQRAELLRGPQSTLLGKNSIAGALNLTTARPTQDPAARLSIAREVEFNGVEVNGMISTPLGESAAMRIAGRRLTEEGYVENTYLDTRQPKREENSIRLSFNWSATENLELFLKGEKHSFETIGRPIEITYDQPLQEGGLTYNEWLQILNQPGLDDQLDYRRQADTEEFSDNTVDNITFKGDYSLGDHTITFVTGWLQFDYTELCDCDFVAAEIVPVNLAEEYEQFSQEIRIASPVGETVEWLAGAYYQDYEQQFSDRNDISATNFLTGSYPQLTGTGMLREFEQNSDSWAVFGRVTWNVSDAWHLTVGARYTEETKKASKSLNVVSLDTGEVYDNPLTGLTYMGVFLTENEQARYFLPDPEQDPGNFQPLLHSGYDVSGSRDESAFTPLINIEWDVTDNNMAYAAFSTGFKAGGFDPRSNRVGLFDYRAANPNAPAPPAQETDAMQYFEFDEEKAESAELGMKNTLGGGVAELNVALYHTDYSDLQISQFDGGVGFNVGNVKKTQVQGIEIDGRWLMTDTLTAFYGISWLDFEYKDFKNGNCNTTQSPDTDTDGDGINDTCDYTGKRGVYTPEYTINFSLDYRQPITGLVNFVGILDAQMVDGHQVHVNLDPAGEIDPYTMIGLRLGIESDNWSLAILGKNLLDEHVISYSGNAPLSSNAPFYTNTHYSFVRKPRTIALEATIRM